MLVTNNKSYLYILTTQDGRAHLFKSVLCHRKGKPEMMNLQQLSHNGYILLQIIVAILFRRLIRITTDVNTCYKKQVMANYIPNIYNCFPSVRDTILQMAFKSFVVTY